MTQHPGPSLPNRRARRGVGRTEIMVGVGVGAIIIIIVAALALRTTDKSARAELPLNVDSIRTAQIEYESAFGQFIEASPAPREPHEVDAKAVPWVPSEGFKLLSWAPAAAELRGSYSVSVKKGDFRVNGVSDLDEDKVMARYSATRAEPAAAQTGDDVY